MTGPPKAPLHPAFLTCPIAHRGLHDHTAARPENSIAAALAAAEAGYGIEIDVQRAADDVAMVFHDARLARMTGANGKLATHRSEALGKLRLLRGRETIPTLAEVLARIPGSTPVLIEMKDPSPGLSDTDVFAAGGLAQAVAAAIAGYPGPLALMSFNPALVLRIGRLAPDIPRGLVTCDFAMSDWPLVPRARRRHLAAIADYDNVGASFISHHAGYLTMPRVADLKAAGAHVLCWTIRSRAEEQAARRIADGITFEGYLPDHPEA